MDKTEFTQTAITLPVALKQRMSAVKEAVNWSAVARDAFEKKLDQFATARKEQSMSDIVDRLRASKRKIEAESVPEGFECGRSWATNKADYKQLSNLAQWRDKVEKSGTIEQWIEFMQRKGLAPSDPLAKVIEGDKELDQKTIKRFWDSAFDGSAEQRHDKVFVAGFAKGALSVWDSVKHQI
jgi:hypothetical protein